jgi:hypothetical protein
LSTRQEAATDILRADGQKLFDGISILKVLSSSRE